MVALGVPWLRRWDVYGVYHAVADLEGYPRRCDLRRDDEMPWAWGYLVAWPVVTCLACPRISGKREAVWNGFEYEWVDY